MGMTSENDNIGSESVKKLRWREIKLNDVSCTKYESKAERLTVRFEINMNDLTNYLKDV